MRNTRVGVVLAIVFVAAIFAAGQYGPKSLTGTGPAAPGSGGMPPAEAASKIQPSFVGRTKIGDWSLFCTEPRKLPKPPPLSGGIQPPPSGAPNSTGVKMEGPPPGFMIPRCQAISLFPVPGHPTEAFRVTFRLLGFKRRLAVFIQVPEDAGPGEQIEIKLNNRSLSVPVRACNEVRARCLAAQTFKPEVEASTVMPAKTMSFVFQPGPDGKPRVTNASAYGLPETVATIRRIDK